MRPSLVLCLPGFLTVCLGAGGCSATALDVGSPPENVAPGEAAWPMLAGGPAHTSRSSFPRVFGTTRHWDLALHDAVHTSPVIAGDGTVYVASDHALHAVGPNGRLRWSVPVQLLPSHPKPDRDPREVEALPSPAIAADGLVYVRNGAALEAYGPDGELHARHVLGNEGVASSPTIGPDGTIYVATWDGALRALAPEGERVLREPAMPDTSVPSWSSTPTLAEDAALLFVENSDAYYAANVHTVQAEDSAFLTLVGTSDFSREAHVVAGPVMLLASRRGLFGFDADGGNVFHGYASALNWTQSNLAVGADGTSYVAFHSTDPQARFHVRSEGSGFDHAGLTPALTAFDPEGNVVFQRDLHDVVRALAIAGDGTLYAAGHTLHKLDAAGRELSRIALEHPCVTPLAIDRDGTAVFVGEGGVLLAR